MAATGTRLPAARWATAVDLRQFVAGSVEAQHSGAADANGRIVDTHFYTSEVRAQMVRGELPAEIIVVFGGGRAPAMLVSISCC